MKRKVFSVVASCCFLALFAAATVQAQMPGTALRAKIPFDFIVRGKILPAGTYEIKRINGSAECFEISNVEQKKELSVFNTDPVDVAREPKRDEIVFHRYGELYFLSEVLTGGEQSGREATPSRQERAVKRELASNGDKVEPQTVTVAEY